MIFSGGNSQYCAGKSAAANLVSAYGWVITDGGYNCPPENDFVITVKTDNAGTSTSTQFTIPTTGGETYNYNVDCNNDGVNEATAQTGDYTCNYAAAGTYTVRIKDNTGLGTGFPRIYFNTGGDRQKLLTIEQWGKGKWTSMDCAFLWLFQPGRAGHRQPRPVQGDGSELHVPECFRLQPGHRRLGHQPM